MFLCPTDIDWTLYSILASVHCNIVSGFLLVTYETVYSAYLQCTLVWRTQHINSVHVNIYQDFLLVNDKTVYSAISSTHQRK